MTWEACPKPPADSPQFSSFNISDILKDKVITSIIVAVFLVIVGASVSQTSQKSLIISEGSQIQSDLDEEPEIEVIHFVFPDLSSSFYNASYEWNLTTHLNQILRDDSKIGGLHSDFCNDSAHDNVTEWYEVRSRNKARVLLRYVIFENPLICGDKERYYDIVFDLTNEAVLTITEVSDNEPIQFSCGRTSQLING